MKKIYFLLFTLLITAVSFGQGTEDFTNSNATSGYADNNFVGNNGITWSYIESRDANNDSNGSGISLPALMLRNTSSKITSSTISGGITDFSVKLYKGFTGSGNRQVELFINGTSYGTSTVFDDLTEHVFSVTGINVAGNIVIEIVNTTSKQVIIDDITWTAFATSCGVTLNTAVYTCGSNTVGDNNDLVVVNIPYTGVDAGITSVTTTSSGFVGGDNPASITDGTIAISGLSEGDTWDIVLNGGDCDTFSASGVVPAAECDPIPNTCFDLSNGSDTFELVTVTPNSDSDEWTLSSGTYEMNGYCGGSCAEAVETWMVFGPLDLTSVTDLALAFDATEQFGVTDLNISYASSYSGCPSSTSWTVAQTLTDAGSYSVDLSAASGTDVYIGVQYMDDGADGYSGWSLSNVALNAFGSCPTLGTVVASNCAVCDVILGTESYTCATNTAGDNNDMVTIEIPYTGMDNTITSVTTSSAGSVSGDNPAAVTDGTITITGLGEGDTWDITINGGDCDGTTTSGTVPASECNPAVPTDLVINEILADPDATSGDANGDGSVSTTQDEFVEIYNNTASDIDISDYVIADAAADKHVFPAGTIIPANGFVTVFGGGTPTGINGIAQTASTNGLGLNNGGDTVTLKDDTGATVTEVTYGSEGGNNQSIAREPDFTGSFVQHLSHATNPIMFTPGEKNDGTSTLGNDSFNKTNFSIYPNPTNLGYVTIKTTTNSVVNVTVYNMLGKQVISQELKNNTLNVTNLNTGIYLVKLTQDGASTTKKLVIK